MKYTVVWIPAAERELLSIWLSTRLRQRVTEAASLLDRALARNPYEVGESREGTRRIAFETPLAIDFEVIEADRLVRVLALWEHPRHK